MFPSVINVDVVVLILWYGMKVCLRHAYALSVVIWKISRWKRRHATLTHIVDVVSSLSLCQRCTSSNSHAIVYDLYPLLLSYAFWVILESWHSIDPTQCEYWITMWISNVTTTFSTIKAARLRLLETTRSVTQCQGCCKNSPLSI